MMDDSDGARPLTRAEQDTFDAARHDYLRVTSQGQTRLAIGTFLTGLTFAAFTALLAAAPIMPTATTPVTPDQVLFGLSGALMGLATLLFLLTTASTYAALQVLANVSPTATKALSDGTLSRLDPRDVQRLQTARALYMKPSHWIPWGLVVLVLSMPLIGWRTHPFIGVATAIIVVVLAVQLWDLVQVGLAGVRRRPQ